ncbi:hypothetical protein CC80DRAFT_24173 [Byssothecium circinans]|uniref:Uncharacterized protein n=1 Tax=Byssothecium circinans TaxID=147558 RepID=A0A6A5U1G7_9PLEO|nr:hypothetical protein CC80DRAFT_24173 [Byssothecium circinans]
MQSDVSGMQPPSSPLINQLVPESSSCSPHHVHPASAGLYSHLQRLFSHAQTTFPRTLLPWWCSSLPVSDGGQGGGRCDRVASKTASSAGYRAGGEERRELDLPIQYTDCRVCTAESTRLCRDGSSLQSGREKGEYKTLVSQRQWRAKVNGAARSHTGAGFVDPIREWPVWGDRRAGR